MYMSRRSSVSEIDAAPLLPPLPSDLHNTIFTNIPRPFHPINSCCLLSIRQKVFVRAFEVLPWSSTGGDLSVGDGSLK
jgi:hypothetical protein